MKYILCLLLLASYIQAERVCAYYWRDADRHIRGKRVVSDAFEIGELVGLLQGKDTSACYPDPLRGSQDKVFHFEMEEMVDIRPLLNDSNTIVLNLSSSEKSMLRAPVKLPKGFKKTIKRKDKGAKVKKFKKGAKFKKFKNKVEVKK